MMFDIIVIKRDGPWGRQLEFKDVSSFSMMDSTFSFTASSGGWEQTHVFDMKKWIVAFDEEKLSIKVMSR